MLSHARGGRSLRTSEPPDALVNCISQGANPDVAFDPGLKTTAVEIALVVADRRAIDNELESKIAAIRNMQRHRAANEWHYRAGEQIPLAVEPAAHSLALVQSGTEQL